MPFGKGISPVFVLYDMLSGRKPSFLPLLEILSYGQAE